MCATLDMAPGYHITVTIIKRRALAEHRNHQIAYYYIYYTAEGVHFCSVLLFVVSLMHIFFFSKKQDCKDRCHTNEDER